MNTNRMIDNVIDQIKEAQLKLGFANEIIRLYFPAESLCRLLQIENGSAKEVLSLLEGEQSLKASALGKLRFSLCGGNRIEVCIPPEGAAYVHQYIPDPPFLSGLIELFRENHSLTIDEIRRFFAQFNDSYVCESMGPGADCEYVLEFPDGSPEEWYYCIKMEMGHTIYHRFTREDYQTLIF